MNWNKRCDLVDGEAKEDALKEAMAELDFLEQRIGNARRVLVNRFENDERGFLMALTEYRNLSGRHNRWLTQFENVFHDVSTFNIKPY